MAGVFCEEGVIGTVCKEPPLEITCELTGLWAVGEAVAVLPCIDPPLDGACEGVASPGAAPPVWEFAAA